MENEGWIEWAGGECPVDSLTNVEIRGRDGCLDTGAADEWCWDWMLTWPESDIIAYRITEPLS